VPLGEVTAFEQELTKTQTDDPIAKTTNTVTSVTSEEKDEVITTLGGPTRPSRVDILDSSVICEAPQ
jgi:hypothetical protein